MLPFPVKLMMLGVKLLGLLTVVVALVPSRLILIVHEGSFENCS